MAKDKLSSDEPQKEEETVSTRVLRGSKRKQPSMENANDNSNGTVELSTSSSSAAVTSPSAGSRLKRRRASTAVNISNNSNNGTTPTTRSGKVSNSDIINSNPGQSTLTKPSISNDSLLFMNKSVEGKKIFKNNINTSTPNNNSKDCQNPDRVFKTMSPATYSSDSKEISVNSNDNIHDDHDNNMVDINDSSGNNDKQSTLKQSSFSEKFQTDGDKQGTSSQRKIYQKDGVKNNLQGQKITKKEQILNQAGSGESETKQNTSVSDFKEPFSVSATSSASSSPNVKKANFHIIHRTPKFITKFQKHNLKPIKMKAVQCIQEPVNEIKGKEVATKPVNTETVSSFSSTIDDDMLCDPYSQSVLLEAEKVAKQHELEENRKLSIAKYINLLQEAEKHLGRFEKAGPPLPNTADESTQVDLPPDEFDTRFIDSIKTYLRSMNARQKMHFKADIYKALIAAFDDSSNFPSPSEGTTIKQITQNHAASNPTAHSVLIEQMLSQSERRLVKELAAVVLAARNSSDIMAADTSAVKPFYSVASDKNNATRIAGRIVNNSSISSPVSHINNHSGGATINTKNIRSGGTLLRSAGPVYSTISNSNVNNIGDNKSKLLLTSAVPMTNVQQNNLQSINSNNSANSVTKVNSNSVYNGGQIVRRSIVTIPKSSLSSSAATPIINPTVSVVNGKPIRRYSICAPPNQNTLNGLANTVQRTQTFIRPNDPPPAEQISSSNHQMGTAGGVTTTVPTVRRIVVSSGNTLTLNTSSSTSAAANSAIQNSILKTTYFTSPASNSGAASSGSKQPGSQNFTAVPNKTVQQLQKQQKQLFRYQVQRQQQEQQQQQQQQQNQRMFVQTSQQQQQQKEQLRRLNQKQLQKNNQPQQVPFDFEPLFDDSHENFEEYDDPIGVDTQTESSADCELDQLLESQQEHQLTTKNAGGEAALHESRAESFPMVFIEGGRVQQTLASAGGSTVVTSSSPSPHTPLQQDDISLDGMITPDDFTFSIKNEPVDI